MRVDDGKAYRTVECGRHPAGRDTTRDLALFDDLARLCRHNGGINWLQTNEARIGGAGGLPLQLGFACKVVLVELDRPIDARAVRLGEAVGVLAHDEVTFLEPQDALRFEAERERRRDRRPP